MRVAELSLRNYRVYEEVDLELPSRVIGIFGPNGSGKTTLVEAVRFALYGRARTEKREIRTHGVLTDCEVRLVFEHGGRQYEVRRRIKGKGHQAEAELFVGDLQAASGVTEVDEEIRRLLRMDEQVFRASVFAEQKQLDAFSDVTRGKRKEMVLRLLGIRPVDDARAAARKESRDATGVAERLAGTLPDLAEEEARLEGLQRELDAARAAAETASTALQEAEARAREASEAFRASDRRREEAERLVEVRKTTDRERARHEERARELEARMEALREEVSQLASLRDELASLGDADARLAAGRKAAELAGELAAAERELASLPAVDPEAALQELEEAEAEHREADREVTRAESRLERLREQLATARETAERTSELDPSAPCPTCGQELGTGFESYVQHCRREADRLAGEIATAEQAVGAASARRNEAGRRLAGARKAGQAAREAVQQRGALAERVERLRTRLEDAAAPFDGRVPDVQGLEADAARARELHGRVARLEAHQRHLEEDERDLAAARSQVDETTEGLAELDRRLAELAFDAEDHARLAKEEAESRRLLEEARTAEREAGRRLAQAENEVGKLEASLEQARRTRAKVAELREDARYVERVSVLLDGFRDHLVTRIGPELSREAEAVFRELTNHEYDDLRIDEDTMGIEIADGTQYFPIERFSGSEADLANLALRVAISVHLSRMSGADIGMMVLDEVLGSLDVERKDLFVQTMGRLADRFNQLFVITHAEQVKDAFPASIEVRKVGRRRSQAVLV
ncbi:MAG TPA: SMC family ATPase [Actinomycetota bacterium]|nr:SMC family ATPase [Actinomycetota bacterium]